MPPLAGSYAERSTLQDDAAGPVYPFLGMLASEISQALRERIGPDIPSSTAVSVQLKARSSMSGGPQISVQVVEVALGSKAGVGQGGVKHEREEREAHPIDKGRGGSGNGTIALEGDDENPGEREMSEGLGGFPRPVASGNLAIGSGKKSSNVRVSPRKIEAKSMISGAPGVDKGPKMGQYFGCWKEGIAKQLQKPRGG